MKIRQVIASVCCVFVWAGVAAAQTPFTTSEVAKPRAPAPGTPAAASGVSAANAWIGSQLGYKFGANSEQLGDNLLVSASVIYDLPLAADRKFHLPVISNFADLIASPKAETAEEGSEDKIKELIFASSGVRAGMYPYRPIEKWSNGTDFKSVVHGEVSWKMNGFKEEGSEEADYLHQLRLAAGVEFAIGRTDDGGRPFTVSVTPVHIRFDRKVYEKIFEEKKSSLTTLEAVAVLPISGKTGVLFEYVAGDVSSFRVGVIIAAAK
jgi:hypothetical protein